MIFLKQFFFCKFELSIYLMRNYFIFILHCVHQEFLCCCFAPNFPYCGGNIRFGFVMVSIISLRIKRSLLQYEHIWEQLVDYRKEFHNCHVLRVFNNTFPRLISSDWKCIGHCCHEWSSPRILLWVDRPHILLFAPLQCSCIHLSKPVHRDIEFQSSSKHSLAFPVLLSKNPTEFFFPQQPSVPPFQWGHWLRDRLLRLTCFGAIDGLLFNSSIDVCSTMPPCGCP